MYARQQWMMMCHQEARNILGGYAKVSQYHQRPRREREGAEQVVQNGRCITLKECDMLVLVQCMKVELCDRRRGDDNDGILGCTAQIGKMRKDTRRWGLQCLKVVDCETGEGGPLREERPDVASMLRRPLETVQPSWQLVAEQGPNV